MAYTGDIIEESLTDPSALKEAKIIATRVEPITEQHQTPWLKQWTLHKIEVKDSDAESLAEKFSHVLDDHHWYIDYKNDAIHYIIFPNKVFRIDRTQPEQYKPVVSYGLSIKIPRHQLDFSPEIAYWER